MKILGLSGSLRKDSHNTRLLLQLAQQVGQGVRMEICDAVLDVPVFNEDLEGPATPGSVSELWRAVGSADGIVVATPEYNQALPGSTKNLIDWISRAPGAGILSAKPMAVVGATVGSWGTRIAQQQLRTVLSTLGARVMVTPSLFQANVADRDFEPGALVAFMAAFTAWVRPTS